MGGITRSISYQRSCMVSVVLSFGFLLVVFLDRCHASEPVRIQRPIFHKKNSTVVPRKLLRALAEVEDDGAEPKWIVGGSRCPRDGISINQGPSAPLPSGIPTYTVIIENVLGTEQSIYNLHLACEWFSSARLINPKLFKRLSYNDCLVKTGKALGPGETVTFQYANSFPFPLSVLSLSCY